MNKNYKKRKKIEAIDKGRSIYGWYHILFRFILLFFAFYKLTWDVASSFPFSLEGARKRFLFYNQSFFVISPIKSIPFLKFSRDHLRSTLGITCGRGSFAVHFGDHLRLGIICGTVQHSRSREKHFPTSRDSPYTSIVLQPPLVRALQQIRTQSSLLHLL